MLIQPLN